MIAFPKSDGSDHIARTRSLLRSHRLVIVGGLCKNAHLERIRIAFHPARVCWIPTRERDPGGKQVLGRIPWSPETIVVALVGLNRHGLIDLLRKGERKHDSKLVWYRGKSPHPHGIAEAIQRQASKWLGGDV